MPYDIIYNYNTGAVISYTRVKKSDRILKLNQAQIQKGWRAYRSENWKQDIIPNHNGSRLVIRPDGNLKLHQHYQQKGIITPVSLPSCIRSIVFIRTHDSIGDLVSITSAIQAAKKQYSNAVIIVKAPLPARSILENHIAIDKLCDIDEKLSKVSLPQPSVEIDLSHPCPCGEYENKLGSDTDKSRNEIFTLASGLLWKNERPKLYLTKEEKDNGYELVYGCKPDEYSVVKHSNKPKIGVVLRSSDIWKDWPHVNNFIELASHWADIYVIDSKKKYKGNASVVNLVKLSLRELMSALVHLDIVVTLDTSIMHLCDALNIRCVALFGSMPAHLHYRKYLSSVSYIQGLCKDNKQPCLYNICDEERYLPCMFSISVEYVTKKVKDALAKNHRAALWNVNNKDNKIVVLSNGGLGDDIIRLNTTLRLAKDRHVGREILYVCRQYYDIYDDFNFCDFEVAGEYTNDYLVDRYTKNYNTVYDMRYVGKCISEDEQFAFDKRWMENYNNIYENHFKARDISQTTHYKYLLEQSLGLDPNSNFILPPPKQSALSICDEDYIVIVNSTDPTQPFPQTKSIDNNFLLELCNSLYPRYQIVEVGTDERASTGFEHSINLINKTSLKDVIDIIRNSVTMITCEGGLAHVAAWVKKPSIVLFGPTPVQFFGYDANVNLTTNMCQNCFLDNKQWHIMCNRQDNICMKSHSVTDVIDAINKIEETKIPQVTKSVSKNIVPNRITTFNSDIELPSLLPKPNQEKIVIVRMKGTGDVLMSWFGVDVLRHKNPDAHITYVTSQANSCLFYGQETLVDNVIVSDWDYEPDGIPELPGSIKNVPHDKLYDLTNRIDFHDTIEKELGSRELLHSSPRANNLAMCMGVELNEGNIYHRQLNVPPGGNEWALEHDLVRYEDEGKLVCCQLDAKGATRNWHIDRWIQLSELLIENGYRVIWFSVTPEHQFLKKDGILNLSCHTTLPQMVALMSKCQYAISTCSASIHIAHRLPNTIPIGIYGSTDYKLLATYYDDLIPVTNYNMNCAPCADWGHECLNKQGAPWCINQISPKKILDVVKP